MGTGDFRIVEPPFSEQSGHMADDQSTVIGVVLAAGRSSRFGEKNKLLTEWMDTPLVSHVVDNLSQSVVDKVVVVVGYDAERVQAAVSGFEVTIVNNQKYAAGQATSVRRGVEAARTHEADAIVFALGDMPAVDTESIDLLVSAYYAGVGYALATAFEGNRGNPVLFARRHFDALANITGDTGGRGILRNDDRAALVETGDRGVLIDVDSLKDMEKL